MTITSYHTNYNILHIQKLRTKKSWCITNSKSQVVSKNQHVRAPRPQLQRVLAARCNCEVWHKLKQRIFIYYFQHFYKSVPLSGVLVVTRLRSTSTTLASLFWPQASTVLTLTVPATAGAIHTYIVVKLNSVPKIQ